MAELSEEDVKILRQLDRNVGILLDRTEGMAESIKDNETDIRRLDRATESLTTKMGVIGAVAVLMSALLSAFVSDWMKTTVAAAASGQ